MVNGNPAGITSPPESRHDFIARNALICLKQINESSTRFRSNANKFQLNPVFKWATVQNRVNISRNVFYVRRNGFLKKHVQASHDG